MKKRLLFCLSCGIAATAFAQTQPVVLPEFYSMRISPDGSVIVSEGYESVELYKVATGERIELDSYRLGSGNCISADGSVIVAATESDSPVMLKNGEEVDLSAITEVYQSANFNGITADAKRIVGWVFNPALSNEDINHDEGSIMYVPMYVDVNEDGTLGEVQLLPYPSKDWLGVPPQYVTASFISNDGKTILGYVMSNSGMETYPVIYKEDADGNWSYKLPTESLINPNKLPLPEDPGNFDLVPPAFKDYMTEEEYQKYQAAYDAWVDGGYEGEMPDFSNYMTAEEIDSYNEAAEAYNDEAMAYNDKFMKYYDDLSAIQKESTFFVQNAFTMDAEGKKVALAAEKEVIVSAPDAEWPETEIQNPTFILDIESEEISQIKNLENGCFPLPAQILSDGSVIASTPKPSFWAAVQRPPQGFVLKAGADQYIPIEEKLSEINPEGAAWLEKNYKKTITLGYDYNWETEEETEIRETMLMTGHICVSDNWSVITGGVLAYLYNAEEESEEEPSTLESYVIQNDLSSVSEIASDAKLDSVKYYDLNGFEIKNPEKGIFIVRSTYSDGSVKTSKAVVRK